MSSSVVASVATQSSAMLHDPVCTRCETHGDTGRSNDRCPRELPESIQKADSTQVGKGLVGTRTELA